MNYFAVLFFALNVCSRMIVLYNSAELAFPNVPLTVIMYGPGAGGGSGSYIQSIVYASHLSIAVNSEFTHVYGGDVSLVAGGGNGMFGGRPISTRVGIGGTLVLSENGTSGSHKVCVNGPCTGLICPTNCAKTTQQIIPGSGGLSPHHLTTRGTTLGIGFNKEGKYEMYNTNYLTCCNKVKCVTECVEGIDGYIGSQCAPGKGGSGYVAIIYEEDVEDIWIVFAVISLTSATLFVAFAFMVRIYIEFYYKRNNSKLLYDSA